MTTSIFSGLVVLFSASVSFAGAEGWINSPLLGQRRELGTSSEPGVRWFLRKLEAYEDTGMAPPGRLFADITYKGAIRLRVYGEGRPISKSSVTSHKKRLEDRPGLYRLDEKGGRITGCHHVVLEKIGDSELFGSLDAGDIVRAQVGNMPCDLILDALTIPFTSETNGMKNAVRPELLLPHLGEQYGAGLLSHAISWRLVDRGLGWPPGDEGDSAAAKVAEVLARQCVESPWHLRHGWCLRDLRRLAKNAGSDAISAVLADVEAEVADKVHPGLKKKDAEAED